MFNRSGIKNLLIPMATSQVTAEAITIPAGAAGVVVESQLANRPVMSSNGGSIGGKGDTSLSFGTGTTFVTEVSPGTLDSALANGEYWVDYASGVIHGKKADAGVADTATYKALVLNTDSGIDLANLVAASYAEDSAHTGGDRGLFVLGVRTDTPASLAGTTGDYTGFIFDALNHLWTREGYAPVAEDNTNGVIGIQNKPVAVSTYAWSTDFSTALETSTVTKAAAGVLRSATVRIDSTHATGTYYIQFYNAASLPADGAVTFLCAPIKVQHVTGTDSLVTVDFTTNGVYASTGIVMALSTTEFTKTISGAFTSSTILFK